MRPKPKGIGRVKDSAGLFAALGDETRLELVNCLCKEAPLSITHLAAGFRSSRQAVTKHLRIMEGVGLVRSARKGRERLWNLQRARLLDARLYLGLISNQWDNALARLRLLVEE